jgi:arylsulfatase A-like enzyme
MTVKQLALVLAAFLCVLCRDTSAADSRRPNLILFLIDDQDYESVATFGGRTWTPNLDRMASEGMKFTQAHVSSTVCTPSRYTWLTGRYAGASTSKVYQDACGGPDRQGFPSFNVALERDRMNVGNLLREAGYATGFVGKFHVGSQLDFPEFYGDDGLKPVAKDAKPGPEISRMFAHNEQVMRRYIESLGFSWAKHIYPENMNPPYAHHNPEWTTAAALEFIEANKDGPFHLHYCSTLLHGPDVSWRRSMDYPLVSGAGELKTPMPGMTPRGELLKAIAKQGFDPDQGGVAGEAWIDDALGAVLNKLRQLGIERNTLVVFAPDHGSNSKASLFSRDGTRIPMIAWWPGRIPGGLACDELVQNIDWVPTAFELAGVKPPVNCRLDGRSLVPLLGTGAADGWRNHLYFEMGYARAVATKDWKYIAVRYPAEEIAAIQRATPDRLPRLMAYIGRMGIGTRGAERPGFWDADQLYNLQTDPREQANLASDPRYADQVHRLREALTASIQSVGRPFGEFLPGGNAAPPGQVDAQIAQVKQLDVQGKRVAAPRGESPGHPVPPPAESKKELRKKKKAAQ